MSKVPMVEKGLTSPKGSEVRLHFARKSLSVVHFHAVSVHRLTFEACSLRLWLTVQNLNAWIIFTHVLACCFIHSAEINSTPFWTGLTNLHSQGFWLRSVGDISAVECHFVLKFIYISSHKRIRSERTTSSHDCMHVRAFSTTLENWHFSVH